MSYVAYFAILLVIVFASSAQVRQQFFKLFAKSNLPLLPPAGPLPVSDLGKYYDIKGQALAWERVRGWRVNQMPHTLGDPGPIDHVILTPTLLDFCSGSTGRLQLDFNFLVGAIQRVDFDPNALGGGQDQGLLTVHTPSGQTRLVTSSGFAQTLHGAVARAQTSAA
jgi:hypothetical protein